MSVSHRKVPWIPLAVALAVVPGAVTAVGFAVYGEEMTEAMPFSSSPATPGQVPMLSEPVQVDVPSSVPSAPMTPELLQQSVSSVFSSNGVKGITFAPGSEEFVGRGAAVQLAVGNLFGDGYGSSITLVAHAWNGETESHRCDLLAARRASIVREYLMGRGVPAEAIKTKVVVDPVWGSPSDGGPQVDVLVK